MNKLILTISLLISTAALGKPAYQTQLKNTVTAAKNVSCATCHNTSNMSLNKFGTDYKEMVVVNNFSAEGFQKLMDSDSNGNGITNYVELLNGTNPGAVTE